MKWRRGKVQKGPKLDDVINEPPSPIHTLNMAYMFKFSRYTLRTVNYTLESLLIPPIKYKSNSNNNPTTEFGTANVDDY